MSKAAKQLAYGKSAVGRVFKKGGSVGHDDEVEDRAMVKRMTKPSALKAKGGSVKHGARCDCKACGGYVK